MDDQTKYNLGKTGFEVGTSMGAAGLGMIGANLAQLSGNPWYAYQFQGLGKDIKSILQQRWWEREASVFSQQVSSRYRDTLQTAKGMYDRATTVVEQRVTDPQLIEQYKKKAPPGSFDPDTNKIRGLPAGFDAQGNPTEIIPSGDPRSYQLLSQANTAFYSAFHDATMGFLDAAGRFPQNPIINNQAAGLVQQTQGFIEKVASGPQQAQQMEARGMGLQLEENQVRNMPTLEDVKQDRALGLKERQAHINELNAAAGASNRANRFAAPPSGGGILPEPPPSGSDNISPASIPKLEDQEVTAAINSLVHIDRRNPDSGQATIAAQAKLASSGFTAKGQPAEDGSFADTEMAAAVRAKLRQRHPEASDRAIAIALYRTGSPLAQSLSGYSTTVKTAVPNSTPDLDSEEVMNAYLRGANTAEVASLLNAANPAAQKEDLEVQEAELEERVKTLREQTGTQTSWKNYILNPEGTGTPAADYRTALHDAEVQLAQVRNLIEDADRQAEAKKQQKENPLEAKKEAARARGRKLELLPGNQ